MHCSPSQLSGPPWSTRDAWHEINDTLRFTIETHRDRLGDAIALAQRILQRIAGLDSLLEDLCSQACPDCRDACCQRARVWFDYKDLLVMHLGGNPIPPDQLRGPQDSICRYLSTTGCRLPRIHRPYVCTWYICSTLKQCLTLRASSETIFLENSLDAIKSARSDLENRFVWIVAKGTLPRGVFF